MADTPQLCRGCGNWHTYDDGCQTPPADFPVSVDAVPPGTQCGRCGKLTPADSVHTCSPLRYPDGSRPGVVAGTPAVDAVQEGMPTAGLTAGSIFPVSPLAIPPFQQVSAVPTSAPLPEMVEALSYAIGFLGLGSPQTFERRQWAIARFKEIEASLAELTTARSTISELRKVAEAALGVRKNYTVGGHSQLYVDHDLWEAFKTTIDAFTEASHV